MMLTIIGPQAGLVRSLADTTASTNSICHQPRHRLGSLRHTYDHGTCMHDSLQCYLLLVGGIVVTRMPRILRHKHLLTCTLRTRVPVSSILDAPLPRIAYSSIPRTSPNRRPDRCLCQLLRVLELIVLDADLRRSCRQD